jgi:hypothetical protein
MSDNDSKYRLSVGIPNGIVLTLIGVLVLLTPLTTALSAGQLRIDLIAGATMVLGGLVSLIWGLSNRHS